MVRMALCGAWLTRRDVCTDDDVSATVVSAAIASATAWLYDATCQQFPGLCTSVVRPSVPCGHADVCGCRPGFRRLDLSPWVTGPVVSVDAIAVNSVELTNVDDVDYRLTGGRYLVPHVDGGLWPWPAQHLNRPDGADGTWSVTVTHGRYPPPHVADAAADLARQLIAKCTGGDCLLPDNATSISRDGVTVELNVPTGGKTGLPIVDSIVEMYPCKRTRRMYDPAALTGDTRRVTGG
jgi:hypothetical protein